MSSAVYFAEQIIKSSCISSSVGSRFSVTRV